MPQAPARSCGSCPALPNPTSCGSGATEPNQFHTWCKRSCRTKTPHRCSPKRFNTKGAKLSETHFPHTTLCAGGENHPLTAWRVPENGKTVHKPMVYVMRSNNRQQTRRVSPQSQSLLEVCNFLRVPPPPRPRFLVVFEGTQRETSCSKVP